MGPTAAGKSAVALQLAERLGAEIISVDSMQVYRGMDIGTAKASAEERVRVPHHLVDIADPADDFSVAEFQEAGRAVLGDLGARRVPAVIVGGSGLHLRSLVDPFDFPPTDGALRAELERLPLAEAVAQLRAADPAADDTVDMANPRRVVRALEVWRLTGAGPSQRAAAPAAAAVRSYEPQLPFVGLALDPGTGLAARVAARTDRMLAAGLVAEVEGLRDRLGPTARQAVGYKEVLPHLDGLCDLADARRAVVDATTALARRQRTYFRKDPRLRWLPWNDDPAVRLAAVEEALEGAQE